MSSKWLKPNPKGACLFLSTLFVALNLLPTPGFRYSAMTCRFAILWPWPWMLTALGIGVSLYLLSMRLGAALPPQGSLRVLTGPLLIIPLGLLIAIFTGRFLYVPPEITGRPEHLLFLQGSTDWGGGCLFAGLVSLYVSFGFTAAWHLALALRDLPAPLPFGKALLKSLWILKFHLLLFIVAGTAPWDYDARVTPNDFRNIFLFVALRGARLSTPARLALAPLFTVLWLVLGSNGNTARAGQIVHAGQDPQPLTRGARHGAMLAWHHLCDGVLGDIHP